MRRIQALVIWRFEQQKVKEMLSAGQKLATAGYYYYHTVCDREQQKKRFYGKAQSLPGEFPLEFWLGSVTQIITLYPRVMALVQIRRLCTSSVRCAGWRFWRRSQTVIQTDEEAARY